jgi:hypothetical protein
VVPTLLGAGNKDRPTCDEERKGKDEKESLDELPGIETELLRRYIHNDGETECRDCEVQKHSGDKQF